MSVKSEKRNSMIDYKEAKKKVSIISILRDGGYKFDKSKGKISPNFVLRDEHGKEMRSIELASWLEHKRATSRRLVFIIGGPYGFSSAVYQRCNEQLSLSKLTFSHQMIRLVFTEQIYRACTIIKGEPYHHE